MSLYCLDCLLVNGISIIGHIKAWQLLMEIMALGPIYLKYHV